MRILALFLATLLAIFFPLYLETLTRNAELASANRILATQMESFDLSCLTQ